MAKSDKSTDSRILEVGWLMDKVNAALIWGQPKALDLPSLEDASAKAVTVCPAVLQHEARLYEIPCPIDAKFSIQTDKSGRVGFRNELGNQSPINVDFLQNMIVVGPADQWRHPKRPIIQIHTPFRFLADEYCYLNAFPPFHDYKSDRWPGVMIGGRFQMDVWPRKLMWAFEWHDIDQPLELKRGEPWFYLRFEAMDPAKNSRLIEAEWTPELEEYVAGIEEVTNYVNKTLSLFKIAQERRPANLVSRKKR